MSNTQQSVKPAQTDRGRTAKRPSEIPARGWLDVSWRAAKRFSDDNVTLIAGGLAMYALLSVFPALAATVSIYGMFATPADVVKQMGAFAGVLPPGVWDIFNTQLQSIAQTGQSTLTFAAVLGIILALWSARAAMSSLMTAANIAYREKEKRSFIRTTLLSLAFTAGAILGFLLMLTLGVAIPLLLAAFGAADWTKVVVSVLRLALLWITLVLGFAVIYRYAPARQHAQWRWISPGSIIAATVWLLASALFAFYVTHFAGYAKTYGALGGVVVLLMWFFVSSIVIVLGGQINAELERQTVEDTTVSKDAPLGERRAFAADTVGPTVDSSRPPTANDSAPVDPGTPPSKPQPLKRPSEQSRRFEPEARSPSAGSDCDPTRGPASATTLSNTGAFLEKVARVADPSHSTLSRATAAVSAVRLGAKVLPAAGQLLRRHPLGACVAMGTVVWAVLVMRSPRHLRRP